MTWRPISLGSGSNPARYGYGGNVRYVNCYREMIGEDAKAPWNVFATDGLDAYTTFTNGGGVRAMLALTDAQLLAVAGRLVFTVDQEGTSTAIGAVESDGLVTIARNREAIPRVAFVCGGLLYYYYNGTYAQYTDIPEGMSPISVAHLNGYFSFLTASGLHYASDLDAAEISALSFASAASNPDAGVRNWTRGQDLLIGGTKSIEAWQDVGGDPYPFSRVTAIDVGVLAAGSVADVDQTSAFVAHDGTVRILQGYQAQRISTHAVERFIADEDDPTAMTAASWQSRGHTFYALSGENGTWCYDVATQSWHERESYGYSRWRVGSACQFGRKIVAGDYDLAYAYTMNPDTFREVGNHHVMTMHLPPVHAFPQQTRIPHFGFALDIVPGVGLVSSTDSLANPTVILSYSDDGGANWSTEREMSIGAAGQTMTRCKANRLGAAFSRTYKVSISAAVARCILGAAVKHTPGPD